MLSSERENSIPWATLTIKAKGGRGERAISFFYFFEQKLQVWWGDRLGDWVSQRDRGLWTPNKTTGIRGPPQWIIEHGPPTSPGLICGPLPHLNDRALS